MSEKLALLHPEIVLFSAACVVLVLGLSPSRRARDLTGWLTGLGLATAGWLALRSPTDSGGLVPGLLPYAKALVAFVGLLLLPLMHRVADADLERESAASGVFSPQRASRGEFFAFMLFSLTGVMLCVSADDLIWLFLALELTSLPTYIMVATSTRSARSLEAGVKYFFLGAFGAAMFLFGFALLYGATGTTMLPEIRGVIEDRGFDGVMFAGAALALIGVSFKIAAAPMHFYTPDVYQGSASSVSAFLAFAPKAAGIFTIIQLCAMIGWTHGEYQSDLPEGIRTLLWVMAAVSMTVGNALALLQRSAKRMLAYSSVAHSGYMLVGVIAGPDALATNPSAAANGLAATLFYLLCYGVMNTGAFAVLAALEKRNAAGEYEGVDMLDDLRGLIRTRPLLAWVMTLCALSLLGFPPLLGFVGKALLFTSAISSGEIALVIVLGLNSAVGAYYYLRLAAAPMLEEAHELAERPRQVDALGRRVAGAVSAAGVLVLVAFAAPLLSASHDATIAVRLRETGEGGFMDIMEAMEGDTPATDQTFATPEE